MIIMMIRVAGCMIMIRNQTHWQASRLGLGATVTPAAGPGSPGVLFEPAWLSHEAPTTQARATYPGPVLCKC